MTELLQKALEAVSKLPPERQDQAARAMFDVVNGAEEDVYVLSEGDKAAIERGRVAAARGEFATEEQVEAILSKYAR